MTQPKDLSHSQDLEHRFRASESFHLGEAVIAPSLNRIEMRATEYQIEPKVMKVLLALCARPGHVVYRDQILQQVWGHTGDDYLLNRAISELRRIFGDSAQSPAYIETIRKTGYRLMAPIRPVASAAPVASVASAAPGDPTAQEPAKTESLPPKQQPNEASDASGDSVRKRHIRKRWRLGAVGVVAVFAVLGVVLAQTGWLAASPSFSINHFQAYPATHFPGREYDAALSPDGSRIAYVADEPGKPPTVFVKMLQGEQALPLSQGEGDASSPEWMPDGRAIVYLNLAAPNLGFVRVSPLGGLVQTLDVDAEAFGVRGMSIANDGDRLAYAKRSAPEAPYQLWLYSIASGERTRLTEPAPRSLGDIDPLFTPDGKTIVFVRGSDEVTKDIYRLDLASKTLTRLTFDNRKINGLAWSPDGGQLLFTSTRTGLYRLWSMERNGGEPQPLALGWETVQRPTTAFGVDALVFEDWQHTAKLMSLNLTGNTAAQPTPLKMSHRWDSNPSISPNGKTVVFASNRSGPFGIWRSELDSEIAHKWATLDGAFIDNPTWSPDGSRIAFDASPDGISQLYLLEQDSSIPPALALGKSDNRNPAWSRDGEWIYFESNRSGSWRIYGWREKTGEIRPVAVPAGKNPQESVDGQWLLFASDGGIRRCHKATCFAASNKAGAADSSESELLVPGVQEQDAYNWVPAREGIYFIHRPQDENSAPDLAFFHYADRSTRTISTLAQDFRGWGMTLAPDESRLHFTEMTERGSDIKVARPPVE